MDFVGIKSINELLKKAERTQTQEPEGEKTTHLTDFNETGVAPSLIPMSKLVIKDPKPGKTPIDSIEQDTKSQPYKVNPPEGIKGNYGETKLYNLKAPQGEEVVIPENSDQKKYVFKEN
ncbi:MAG TPA: hypothetical protein P5136_00420 [Methanofastidiosum sp.]|nr:hypothetical protein [Methanofastidiosum sp.]